MAADAQATIAKGFRGVPWGIKESEAQSYGLAREYTSVYRKGNENNSLGDIPLKHINYIFDKMGNNESKFNSVVMYADRRHEARLAQELVKLFGLPTMNTNRLYSGTTFPFYKDLEWNLANVIVTYGYWINDIVAYSPPFTEVKVSITYKDPNSPQRGGGL